MIMKLTFLFLKLLYCNNCFGFDSIRKFDLSGISWTLNALASKINSSNNSKFHYFQEPIAMEETQEPNPILLALSNDLTDDQPNIETAIKNYITILLGRNAAQTIHSLDYEILSRFSPPICLNCAKLLVKALNSFRLLTLSTWTEKFPQAEEQTASDRLDEINRYKVTNHKTVFLHHKSKRFMNFLCEMSILSTVLYLMMIEEN
jgi:hypothetical protein